MTFPMVCFIVNVNYRRETRHGEGRKQEDETGGDEICVREREKSGEVEEFEEEDEREGGDNGD